ncbi:MAG: hypothetical protein ACFE92_04130 [Promethearchaeota archaeon]
MILRNGKKKSFLIFSFIFLISFSSIFIFSINQNTSSILNKKFGGSEKNNLKNPKLAAQETLTAVWFENPTFEDPIGPTWYHLYGELGDNSDIKATSGSDQANFIIIGDSYEEQILLDDTTYTNWEAFNKTELVVVPQRSSVPYYGIDSDGAWCSHRWDEGETGGQPKNTPVMHWRTNVSLNVDMSDYIITSVDFNAIINGSVDIYIDTPGDTLARAGVSINQYETYDYAQFYVEITTLDINELNTYRIAFNQTIWLGNEARLLYDIEGLIGAYEEQAIINALNNVLAVDPGHNNFTIVLGIYLYCEDNNSGTDLDDWTELRFKFLNLTFSYEKKIDQFTSASWNQDGDKVSDISNDTIIINEAKLNFNYKTDSNWTDASPNSEIRIFINNNKLTETIKLSTATTSFQIAKIGGYDVTSLIPYNVFINFSIQVYLADEFSLSKNITFSIDNLYLNITYTVLFPDYQTNLQIFFNGVNKTSLPFYDHPVGNDLNITVKYPDDTGTHIPGAVVQLSGNLTGTLQEDPSYEQYTIIIDANDFNAGTYDLKIVAHKVNYKLSTISRVLTVSPTSSQDLQLFLNGENKTLDPSFEISLDKLLNITIKYNTFLGTPVTGASVTLSGEGILENLNESVSLNQYSTIINTTLNLKYGTNLLEIEAKKLNHETKFEYPRINIRKINAMITPVNNTNTISTKPGGDATIQVYINNTDFNEIVKGAYVTYSWDFDDGILYDLDNDGIYEVNITDVPAGTHSININAFGSDKYNFISLEIIIAAVKPIDSSFLFRALLIAAIIVSIGLTSYLYAYQTYLKYPKQVRKIRKYRKTLRKAKDPHIPIIKRKKAFNRSYQEELDKTSINLKSKPKGEKELQERMVKESPENSGVELPNGTIKQSTNSHFTNKDKTNRKNKNRTHRKWFKFSLKKKWGGSLNIKNNRKFLYLIFILASLILYSLIICPFISQNSTIFSNDSVNNVFNENVGKLGISAQESFTKQWLDNYNLTTPIEPTWFPSYGELGDSSDVKATSGSDQANFIIIGDTYEEQVLLDDTTFSNWEAFNKSELVVVPQRSSVPYYGIDSDGAWCSHRWWEGESGGQPKNTPVMHWRTNVSLSVDMSDYVITSVDFNAIINASVDMYIDTPGDTLARAGVSINQYETYDYARFYVEITTLDVDELNTYRIAFNQTRLLGNEFLSLYDIEGFIGAYEEKAIIDALTNVLAVDPGHNNFTIVLGIYLYCEDNNSGTDLDDWTELRFKFLNLTFSYEKKIDQFTSVSWNQDGDKISDISNYTVVVDQAFLNFKYKINDTWPSTSPNSEIRVLINDNLHPETVKLTTANASFQLAKTGGFDVTPLIIEDVNLSIQVYVADEFSLDRNIEISIDDVTLNISYTIILPDEKTDLHLFLDNVNKTDDPEIDIFIGDSLNVTVKYLNSTGEHIINATVQLLGSFAGELEEDDGLGQYTRIINTDISDAGTHFLTIIARAEDHETREIIFRVDINKFESDNLQVLLNNQNRTQDPYIQLTVSQILNITIKYTNLIGTHISGANVLLTSETYSSYLNESISFEHYSIIINTTERLKIGANYLTIEAQAPTFQTQFLDITISIRKINLDIITITGSNSIEAKKGDNIRLQVRLNNTDFGGFVKGAFLTYTWQEGDGILTDDNNDGIYEATISNFPEGTYSIELFAFVGDDYNIDMYQIFVSATSEEEEENIIFPILFSIFLVLISGLAIYLYAYQTYLKYPKQVRKVRKYRKSLNRKEAPKVQIIGRETAFKSYYNENLGKDTSNLKLKRHPGITKSMEQKISVDKAPDKSLEKKMDQDQLTRKVIEKKEELDELIKDSSK